MVLSIGLFCFGLTGNAFAIPSPELIVGSLSSLSQMITVIGASLGGVAAVGLGMRGKGGRDTASSKTMRRLLVVLTLLVLGFGALNVFQYTSYQQTERARLESTLVRPSRDPGQPVADANLKELNYSQQLRHPRGLSTKDAEALMNEALSGKRPDIVLLDIRETAETEMGSLPGAKIVRYADLAQSGLDLKGKTPLLFCHNGNRSSETCQALADQGIDCRFITGGLEKWVVENRRMTGKANRQLDELRAIPSYRNESVLLDTPQVKKLVDEEGAIFLDVRYPGEFAQRHIPGAINMTIRNMPTDEMKRRIAALPQKPVIVPCYDRRSCFFGEIIGLELDRAGRDFRGRYTVPWEYFTASTAPPHVVEWQALNSRSYWTRAVDAFANLLRSAEKMMPYWLVIALLALLSRLIILPVSIKSERDQMTTQRVAPEMAALKQRFADDPVRLSRAVKAFYKRHGLTPGRNMLALLLLPVLALSISAIDALSPDLKKPFLWLSSAQERDWSFMLPLAFAGLICLYLDQSLVRTRKHRLITWLVGFPLLFGLACLFTAGAAFYVTISALLLVLQRLMLTTDWRLLRQKIARAFRQEHDVVSLDEPERLAHGAGNKAYRLAVLRRAGVNVPDGVVLTHDGLQRFHAARPEDRNRIADKIWARIGAERLAVRSSAAGEDGALHSFAGIYESLLDVQRVDLAKAIMRVMDSFSSERAAHYIRSDLSRGNVLIQAMVKAEYAGVLFTQAPGAPATMMVEMVQGTAEDLVSGNVTPQSFRYGGRSGTLLDAVPPPIDLAPLLAIGRKAVALFGAAQDIEWTYAQGHFLIVQSRDITAGQIGEARHALLETERLRLLTLAPDGLPAQEPYLIQTELSELLPRPTPLSLDLMERIWAGGGSVDLACRSLGFGYQASEDGRSYLKTVFGRLYVDKAEQDARAPRIGSFIARRLIKRADAVELHLRETVLPGIEQEMAVFEATDFSRMERCALRTALLALRDRFVTQSYAETAVVNILAGLYVDVARKALEKKGLDAASYLTASQPTLVMRGLDAARALSNPQRQSVLINALGHRAAIDYELSSPRYSEVPDMLERMASLPASPAQSATPSVRIGDAGLDAKTARLVDVARRFTVLKDDAKHVCLREVAVLRRMLLALDGMLHGESLVFWLDFGELETALVDANHALWQEARVRREAAKDFMPVPALPGQCTLLDIETAILEKQDKTVFGAGASWKGKRVAGRAVVEGRARVISLSDAESGEPIADLQPGDIIVSPLIHQLWVEDFRRVAGVVSEIGAFLSHTAIIAREYDVPMIVGVAAVDTIPDGALIRLGENGVVTLVSHDVAVAAE